MKAYLSILREKFVRLGREEEGAALVVTLAIFMFMYLLCIGVYAVGMSVKQRIHLQNACDAAAYSAAVVQADTLSRIATINRAMSWTYAQMTRRQMDHVTYRWLTEVARHWRSDRARAQAWARASTAVCEIPLHHGMDWHCSDITLQGASRLSVVSCTGLETANNLYRAAWVGQGPSFYSSASMEGQISADWAAIEKMGRAIDNLKNRYESRVRGTIDDVLAVNMKGVTSQTVRQVAEVQPISTWLEEMDNTSTAEDRFLRFSGETVASAFGTAGNVWFPRQQGNGKGFLRGYALGHPILNASWNWHANQWHCKIVKGVPVCIGPFGCPGCVHSHHRCACVGAAGYFVATVYADNANSKDGYYTTPSRARARPHQLNQNYFGKDGTISVGLACQNENPWSPILGTISKGIFSAFNPYTDWTVCFASAKAGYKRQVGAAPSTRNYRIDWNGIENWNLCQSDWDAVLVPVRMAQSHAANGRWAGAQRFLAGWVNDLLGHDGNIRAGGLETPEEVDQYVQAWHELQSGSPSHSHVVTTRWQIGNPNQKIGWDKLTDRMFH